MSQAKLILSKTPPPAVPMRFFLSAPLFGIITAALILWQGEAAFSSRWSPGLLATTHLLVIGYLALVMQGALIQIVSVLTGGQPPRVALLSSLIHTTTAMGTLLLGAGFITGDTVLLHSAITLLGVGFVLFIATITMGLLKASARRDAGAGIALSLACLTVTIGLGIWLALGHGTETIALARNLTDIHLVWGLVGWSGLLLITVAYEVVPMFQLTPVYPPWLRGSLIWVLFAGVFCWSVGSWGEITSLTLIGNGLSALSLAVFALTTLWLQTRRKKKQPEATVWFWHLAMISMLLSIFLWGSTFITPELRNHSAYPLLLGALLIYGLFVSAINGMLYKILPFLSWLHLSIKVTEHKLSRRLIPNIKKVIPDERARTQFWIHLATLLLILATCWQPDWFYIPMAIALAVSNGMLWLNLAGALRVYKHTHAAIEEAAIAAKAD